AHLSRLIRRRVGPFGLERAVSLDRLSCLAQQGDWQDVIWAPDEILVEWPALIVGTSGARALVQGRAVEAADSGNEVSRARAYSASGQFLAVVERRPGEHWWRPVKVLADL
ncbi:MAG TPA: hypothetical protein VHL09_06275, partial [Dehalococcoidia bacterium]|nr:hypothetical protein [Dehalococcoidia bacterium]